MATLNSNCHNTYSYDELLWAFSLYRSFTNELHGSCILGFPSS